MKDIELVLAFRFSEMAPEPFSSDAIMTVRPFDDGIGKTPRPDPQRSAIGAKRVAQDMLAHLCSRQVGAMLVGPELWTAEVVGCLLPLIDCHMLLAIGLTAAGATPATLRERVAEAHAAKPSPSTVLLLVIANAQTLSAALLDELDQAAEAAATYGGLKILLASTEDLTPSFAAAATYGLETAFSCIVAMQDLENGVVTVPARGQDATALRASRHADIIAGHLFANAPGIMLLGPDTETEEVLRRLIERCPAIHLMPVPFAARDGTPESLRAAASRGLAARPDARTTLLLVIADAQVLSDLLLRELDLAAEAAAQFGGLQLLLASTTELDSRFAASGVSNLQASLSRTLGSPRLPAAIDRRHVQRSMAKPARRSSRSVSTGLAAASFAGLSLTALLSFGLIQTMPTSLPISPPAARTAGQPTVRPTAPPYRQRSKLQRELSAPLPAAPSIPDLDEVPEPARAPVGASLLLLAQPDDTLESLYKTVYRGAVAPPYAQVAALNPVVHVGARLVFPPPSAGWPRE